MKKYIVPSMSVSVFDHEDIVTASNAIEPTDVTNNYQPTDTSESFEKSTYVLLWD